MKKIIVTGGLGFIGSNLIKLLIKKNYFVVNVDKVNYASNFYNTRNFSKKSNYKFVKLDINNRSKFKKILKLHKPVAIFNLAAETHVDRSIDAPTEFIKSNIVGVFNLLEVFREFTKKNKKTKLIHISTDEVYGDILKGRSKETDPYKPSSPYAASKASSDHLVYSYVRTFKLNAMITNCSNNYGPHQHPEKLIPKIIHNALNGIEIPVFGDGKNVRDWLYVLDHCEAIDLILKRSKSGAYYNIGGNCEMTNIDIVNLICNILNEKVPSQKSYNSLIKFVEDRLGHDERYAIDATKIQNELNWSPKFIFKDAIDETIDWYIKKLVK